MRAAAVEIQVTCGGEEEATAISDALVEQRLAACVQQVPIRSVFRWRGAVERADEVLLLGKTVATQIDDVCATVRDHHSYDVPAITVVDIVGGSEGYLAWVRAETS